MPPATPPEITLELSGGSLTIRTAEVIYRIVVAAQAGAALPAPPAAPALPASPAPTASAALMAPDDDWGEPEPQHVPASAVEGDQEYYRDLSHDMYREVGRLARRLSMSIRDVKIDKTQAINLEETGVRLEEAKDQLESVVKMTEQATLKIMDLGEGIQAAIDQARTILERMNTPAEDSQGLGQALEDSRQELSQALGELTGYLGGLEQDPLAELLAEAQGILTELEAAPAPELAAEPAPPEPAPAAPAGPRYLFPVEVVFQTVYELCTNETVKKHIKAMWDAGPQGFDAAKVQDGLDAIAPDTPDQDNFLNLDLKNVLKVLFQATGQERFQQVLKKMSSTADQIFLEQTLPLEANPAPAAAAPPPPPPPAPAAAPVLPEGCLAVSAELLERLQALVGHLGEKSASLTPPPLPGDLVAMLEKVLSTQAETVALNVVDAELRDQLEKTMAIVFSSVNNIIEALSFQDLSGQAIYRIVRLLTDFQVQLLAMVVSFGSKLKAKATAKEITVEQSEKMAQAQVDKVMETLGVHETPDQAAAPTGTAEGAASKLDQDAVNDMLADMGF